MIPHRQSESVSNPSGGQKAGRRGDIVERLGVLAIRFGVLVAMLFAGIGLSRFCSVPSGSGVLETELTGIDDFYRAFANYAFVPVLLAMLLDLPVYVAVRCLWGRPSRWAWLLATLAITPIVIAIYYFALWPLLRAPIEM